MTGVDPLVGRDLDSRYTIVDRLGGGAMGAVYRGTQHGLGREVAIKVVTPRLGVDKVIIQRFLREAQLASKLSHPNAVAVLDFGKTQDDLIYLVMELVKGRTLEDLVKAEGKLPAPRVVRIGSQICDALEGAHAMKIVHRDLKPANIMLMSSGRDIVKVLDFGLAKSLESTNVAMTTVGALLGTPAFMPPEAVTGGVVDARADLYSLGCTLFFAAMGRIPFESAAVAEMIAMHAMEPPPPLVGVQVGLARVIERLLAKNPAERYADAAATRDALEESLSAGQDAVKPRATTPRHGTMMGWATPAAGTAAPPRPATGPSPTVSSTPFVKLSTPGAQPATGQPPAAAPTVAARPGTPAAAVPVARPTPVATPGRTMIATPSAGGAMKPPAAGTPTAAPTETQPSAARQPGSTPLSATQPHAARQPGSTPLSATQPSAARPPGSTPLSATQPQAARQPGSTPLSATQPHAARPPGSTPLHTTDLPMPSPSSVVPAASAPMPSPSSMVPAASPSPRADTEVDGDVMASWRTELAPPSPPRPPGAAPQGPRTDLTPPPLAAGAVPPMPRPPDVLQQRSRAATIAWTLIILVILASGGLVVYTLMMRAAEPTAAPTQDAALPMQAPATSDATPVDAEAMSTPADAAPTGELDAAVAPAVDPAPTKAPATPREKRPKQPKEPKSPAKPVLRRTPGVGGN